MSYRSYAEIERDNQELYEDSLCEEQEHLNKLLPEGKEIEVTEINGDSYYEGYEITFKYRNHEYSVVFLYGMPAGYNNRKFVEFIKEKDKELDEEEEFVKSLTPLKAIEELRKYPRLADDYKKLLLDIIEQGLKEK